MSKWYRVSRWSYKVRDIGAVEVVSETTQFVTAVYEWNGHKSERREKKGIAGGELWPTWTEARETIVARARTNLENAKRQLDQARSELQEAEQIPKNAPAQESKP